MKNVKIIGAGQLGSRHLQALKAVSEELNIVVVDPSIDSLNVARERYEAVVAGINHPIRYSQEMQRGGDWDLVIVACNSKARRSVVESLLKDNRVSNLVLEKILFSEPADYGVVTSLVESVGTKAWVNCCMRQMDIYAKIRDSVGNQPIHMSVTGSRFGLITNAIHYFDYMAWVVGSTDFTVDTLALEGQPVEAKRKGYLEFNGTLSARFKNGSFGAVTCFEHGDLPTLVEIHTSDKRFIIRESERKAWVSEASNNWVWQEIAAQIPYQSQMTAELTNQIFASGNCALPSLRESAEIHLRLLRPLASHLKSQGHLLEVEYPFT